MLLFFGENVLIGAEGVPWEGRTGYEMSNVNMGDFCDAIN